MRIASIGWLLTAVLLLTPLARAASEAAAPLLTGVVYLPDGRPARDADLRVGGWRTEVVDQQERLSSFRMPQFTLRTDARGGYQVRLVRHQNDQPAPAGATAKWDLLLISQQGIGYGKLSFQVPPGAPTVQQEVHLLRGDRVSGTVLGYPDGKPVEGADVYAVVDEGITLSIPVSTTVTDAKGQFTIPAELPPGNYHVGAAAKGYGLVEGYRPPESQPAQGRTASLRLVHDLRLRGQVLDESGAPVANQRVMLMVQAYRPGGAVGMGSDVTTNARGRFDWVLHWPQDEYDRSWADGASQIGVTAASGGHQSDAAMIDPLQSSTAEVVLKLR